MSVLNRKYDMSFYPLPNAADGRSDLGFGKGNVLAARGPLKASQNYMRVLLTKKGERPEDPQCGTRFSEEISSGRIFLPIQVKQVFSANSLSAILYLQSKYPKDTPLDERVKDAILDYFTQTSPTVVEMQISLYLQDTTKYAFLLPVPI